MSQKLIDAIADLADAEALAMAKELLAQGTAPLVILESCREAMSIVGQRFEEGQYFLSELILAGEMLKEISAKVKPLLQQSEDEQKKGKVLVGTVKGDIHDIGKDIVVFMLDISGFEVKDVGIDVPVQTFVDEIKSFKPDVVALSGFLTLSYASMKETVDAIKAAGLRDGLKIMVGGGVIDQRICDYAGADAFGDNAMAAVTLANQWIGGE